MRRIATHVAIDLLNAARRHASIPLGYRAETQCEHSDGALGDAIAQAFDALPPKLRVIATLALIEERPHAEIAQALGVPIGTVKSRLFRATQKLRMELDRMEVQS